MHSPIVGPGMLEPVARELRAGDVPVVVPTLADDGTQPFWRQHVASAVDDIESQIPAGTPPIVVVHSGAGQLTALLGYELLQRGRRPAGYLFGGSQEHTPIRRFVNITAYSRRVGVSARPVASVGGGRGRGSNGSGDLDRA